MVLERGILPKRFSMPLEPSPIAVGPEPGSPALPPRDRRIAMGVLLAGIVCVGMGQTVVFSVLPPLGRQIGLADMQVAAIFGLSALFWVLLVPLWGRRSDVAGRKPLILLGLSGFVLSMVLFASSIGLGLSGALSGIGLYALILATRSIYGVIGSATPAAAQAYIADRTPPELRTAGMSSFSAAFGIGAMLGPGVGGAVAVLGPVAPLYAVAGLAAVMVIAIWLLLPERSNPIPRLARPKLNVGDRRLRPFLIFGLAFGVINAVPIQTVAFYFIDVLHLDTKEAPQFVGVGLMGAAMASLFSQLVLVQRFGLQPRVLLRLAPLAILFGHLLIAVSKDFGPLVFGLMLSGCGAGMAIPGFTSAASLAVGPDEQGAAAGLSNSAGAFGFVIAPVIGFSLYAVAPQTPFVLTSAMAALLLIYAWMSPTIRRLGR